MNFIENKTFAYLSANLAGRGHIADLINNFYGLYLDDKNYEAYKQCPNSLFFHTDIQSMEKVVNAYPDEIEDNYIYRQSGILVFNIKLENSNWKSDFIKGNYSQIYNKQELEKLKFVNNYAGIKDILTKNPARWNKFKEQVFETFGVALDQYDGRELDLPPNLKYEILNY